MRRFTDDDDRQFTAMWQNGTSVKAIAHELKRAKSSIMARLKLLGLPKRRCDRSASSISFTFRLSMKLKAAISKRAFQKSCSQSEYIKVLIRRDCGIELR